MENHEALAELHRHARRLMDNAWSQDGNIAVMDNPSRRLLDNVRDLFKRAEAADALYRLCLGAYLDAFHAAPPPAVRKDVGEEAIARVIDPEAWAEDLIDAPRIVLRRASDRRVAALAKARAVLALLKTPSPPEPFEGPFPSDDEVGVG